MDRDDLHSLAQARGAMIAILMRLERERWICATQESDRRRRYRLTPTGLRELSRALVEHRSS